MNTTDYKNTKKETSSFALETVITTEPFFPSSFLTSSITYFQSVIRRFLYVQNREDNHPPPPMSGKELVLYPPYAAWCARIRSNPPLRESNIRGMRKRIEDMARSKPLPGGVVEQDMEVKSEGKELRLTILRPADAGVDEVLPIVLFFHGGGFFFGSKYTHGKLIRQICLKSHVMIVFLEYSLAPEAQFPTIHEEAYAALTWVLANHRTIHGDVDRLAVCGDSAGGNLAAALPLMARDRGLPNDTIKTQILLYPQLDHEQNYRSYREFGNGQYGFSADDCKYFGELYSCQPHTKGYTYRYPIHTRKKNLKGLPPALVVSVEADCLRDEAEAYARMLLEAGVDTSTSRRLHTIHAFMSMPDETPSSIETMDLIVLQLKRIFGKC